MISRMPIISCLVVEHLKKSEMEEFKNLMNDLKAHNFPKFWDWLYFGNSEVKYFLMLENLFVVDELLGRIFDSNCKNYINRAWKYRSSFKNHAGWVKFCNKCVFYNFSHVPFVAFLVAVMYIFYIIILFVLLLFHFTKISFFHIIMGHNVRMFALAFCCFWWEFFATPIDRSTDHNWFKTPVSYSKSQHPVNIIAHKWIKESGSFCLYYNFVFMLDAPSGRWVPLL